MGGLHSLSRVAGNMPQKMEGGGVIPTVKTVVVASDMITPYGKGADICRAGLFSGRTAISGLKRFNTKSFQSGQAATIDGLTYHRQDSLVMQMVRALFDGTSAVIPEDANLILASTKGEIDLLERNILEGTGDVSLCNLRSLLEKVSALTGVKDPGTVVSAACASSATAVARAAAMIRSGSSDCVLVVACDGVTEFVYSGFSSLMAIDKSTAKPFDKNRNGLSLGEAAAFVLMMSETRAKREEREIVGEITGWGLSCDANHMTGPSRHAEGLVLSIKKALKSAHINESDVGFIAAHGTGTVYNDAMEMKAFQTVFKNRKRPVYSIKGAIGHTMGATGLVEVIIALRALKDKMVPPTVNLQEADESAHGWVSSEQCPVEKTGKALMTNAGFGGINAALILS
jgi:acetyl-CoA acetyltransferase